MKQNNVEKIKSRLSIEDVVSTYLKLSPAGPNLKARCPFHNEKTPSFLVSPSRGTYHCFGCGEGGDIFSFVQKIEGVDFMGSLKILAERAGVTLVFSKEEVASKSEKETLYEIMESASLYFENQLDEEKAAIEYLKNRGVTSGTIKKFRIGFAPDSWNALLLHLRAKNYFEKDIELAGLSKKSESGRSYSRFRSRIMFPIFDSSGRIVAFSGRILKLENATHSEIEEAKYINSPETILYKKSGILYGFDRAKQTMRQNDFAILVEGQMDLIMSHQSGFANTVALSGTALTQEEVRAIGRMTKNLVIALDSDTAGINATLKSSHRALQNGFDVKIAKIRNGKDPAEIILNDGVLAWKECIRTAESVVQVFLDFSKKAVQNGKDVERSFKTEVRKVVLPLLHSIQSPVERSHFLKIIAKEIGEADHIIESEMQQIPRVDLEMDIQKNAERKQNFTGQLTAFEKAVLFLMAEEGRKATTLNVEGFRSELARISSEEKIISTIKEFDGNDDLLFGIEYEYSGVPANEAGVEILFRAEMRMLRDELSKNAMLLNSASKEDSEKILKMLNEISSKIAILDKTRAE